MLRLGIKYHYLNDQGNHSTLTSPIENHTSQLKSFKHSRYTLLKYSITIYLTPYSEKKHAKDFTRHFTDQLSILVDSKIPLLDALRIIHSKKQPNTFKEIIHDIVNDISHGKSFSQSLSRHAKYFNATYCSTIEAGEQSNSLDHSLHLLNSQISIKSELTKKVSSSLRYPLFLLSSSIIISYVLLSAILPKFSELFNSFNQEIPLFSRNVMLASHYTTIIFPYFFLLLMGTYLIYKLSHKKSTAIKLFYYKLASFLPILNTLISMQHESMLLILLGHLLSQKIVLHQALNICQQSTNNILIINKIDHTSELIQQGKSLPNALRESHLFSSHSLSIITASSQSDIQHRVLQELGLRIQKDLLMTIEKYQKFIEPSIIILLAILIGSVIMAIYLPLFNMGNVI